MIRRIVGRLSSILISLFVVSVAIFLIMELLPGDPAAIMLGTSAQEDTLQALQHQMGLDRSLFVRYAEWVGGVVQGDFGLSATYHVPVSSLITDRLVVTTPLGILAIAMAAMTGIGFGAIAAANRGKRFDSLAQAISQIGLAIPNFWMGLLLIFVFALKLQWFPTGDFPSWSSGPFACLRALFLPALALACPLAAVLFRVSRAATLEVLRTDFIRLALAKGVARRRILWRHALPNAMQPILTVLGLQIAVLVAGTILIESVFNLPGMGQLVLNAMMQRDLAVIRDLALLLSGFVIVINGGIDLLQAAIDPRQRREQ